MKHKNSLLGGGFATKEWTPTHNFYPFLSPSSPHKTMSTSSDASADAAWAAAMRALPRPPSGGTATTATKRPPPPSSLSPTPATPPPSTSPTSPVARVGGTSRRLSTTPTALCPGGTPPPGTLPLVAARAASATRAALVELPPGIDLGSGSGAVGRVVDGGAALDIGGVLCDAHPFATAGTLLSVAVAAAVGAPAARLVGLWTRAITAMPRPGQLEVEGSRVVGLAALEGGDDDDDDDKLHEKVAATGRAKPAAKKRPAAKKKPVAKNRK